MKIYNCRLCKNKLGDPLLKLPPTALANEFVTTTELQDIFPLELCSCDNCFHYQLNETVDPNRLFKDYAFVSGTSKVNAAHFTKLAVDTVTRFNLKPGDFIVEIASNDGTLLKAFKKLGMKVLGIDPAENIAKIANQDGIETLPVFFTATLVKEILLNYGQPKVVIANNVLAHTDYVIDIINGVKELIRKEGIFIFENSYFKDMYEKVLPDLIYHEHVSHFLVHPLLTMFQLNDLNLFDVQNIDVHGGSLRGFVSFQYIETSLNLKKLIQEEYALGLLNNSTKITAINLFNEKINKLKRDLLIKLQAYKVAGLKIAAYGASAKSTTLLYLLGLDNTMIDEIYDDAPLKQNKFSPGLHIPVLPPSAIYEKKPDILLILAWNFANSIIENCQKKWYNTLGNFKSPIFIVPLPELKVIRYREDNTCTCGLGPWEKDLKRSGAMYHSFKCQDCGGIETRLVVY